MLFALVAAVLRPHAGALPERLGPRQGVLSSSSLERMGDATRRERWAPGKMSSPIKHELPCVKSEPALMTHPGERECQRVRRRQAPSRRRARCPPLTAAGNTCCATGATDSANPANPGSLGHCAARQPRLPNPLARHRRTGRGDGAARGDGGPTERHGLQPHRAIAWHVLPVYPRRRHEMAIAGHDGRRCKARVAPPLRAKMYRMCRRPLASFSKCTEGV